MGALRRQWLSSQSSTRESMPPDTATSTRSPSASMA